MVIDHDKKMFNVIESAHGHAGWQERIQERQQSGRNIQGYPSAKHADVLKKEYHEQFGYTYTRDSVL